MKELRPLVDEYHRARSCEQALRGIGTATDRDRCRGAARARRTRRHEPGHAPPRPPEGPARAPSQALDLVKAPRHHHPRARRGDGDQAELPVSRDARPRDEGKVTSRPRLAREGSLTTARLSSRGRQRHRDDIRRARSDQAQLLHRVALLDELVHRRVDLRLWRTRRPRGPGRSSYSPSEAVHGKLEMSPSSTP